MRDYLAEITTPTTPGITPAYTVPRTSALALDMLKLSLQKHSRALRKAGISNPLAKPVSGTGLYYTVYDLVEAYAIGLLRQRVPFYYQTVTGETRAVQSTTRANAAIDYLPQTIKLWGYVRAAVAIPPPTPVYTPPVTIFPEPAPVYSPVVTVTPPLVVEESLAILWAVSYTLAEAGHTAYPMPGGRGRIGVSQEGFDSLVDRASYIADKMVQQDTYSPRL